MFLTILSNQGAPPAGTLAYIKVSGVWQLAEVYIKDGGVWKLSIDTSGNLQTASGPLGQTGPNIVPA